MRKFIGLIVILASLWLVKLSYDSYLLSQRFDLLQQNITQMEQNNANLNDHLVALQRQFTNPADQSSTASEPAPSAAIHTALNPVILVKQQLELVQFALQQHQYIYAVDKLNQLNQSLASYTLAPALERSLHESIIKDKQAIQQFVISKNQQQQSFDDLIQLIDQDLQMAQENTHVELKRQQQQHFWQGWFQLQRVDRAPAELINRRIILKEVQLRLLLARQAINDGHLTEYQHVLSMAIQQLAQLPDQSSQDLKLRLEKLKQLPALPVPKLITLELLG
ncbi:hypothetical protein [Acinetobacter ursingii]|uniref:hypothetical protein n=1 Tax=Acinetobacter ursingii TaxID=108980 RepID=UPI000CA84DB9|nr:hypothetical protein [Acinetobacter ursingii]MCU4351467.1 hypothetical protein [Acinetobacter ursingii]MDI3237749.1 hypothetical protein [Acinetobacter ursingii]PMC97753.1 hypothetical protein CJ183_05900 [Acinetobacter ursingii]